MTRSLKCLAGLLVGAAVFAASHDAGAWGWRGGWGWHAGWGWRGGVWVGGPGVVVGRPAYGWGYGYPYARPYARPYGYGGYRWIPPHPGPYGRPIPGRWGY